MYIYVQKGTFFTSIKFPILPRFKPSIEYFRMLDIEVIKLWIFNIHKNVHICRCLHQYVWFQRNIRVCLKCYCTLYSARALHIVLIRRVNKISPDFDLIPEFDISPRATYYIYDWSLTPHCFFCSSTFAQDYSTYWVGVESPRVTVDKRSIDVLTSSTPVTTFRTTTPPYYSRTVNYVVSIIFPVVSRHYEVNAREYYTGR